ncbi:MAG: hypothetical protein KKG76_06935 [Euryarchaeota archaeon]|nr:hypothetical protein [Euryarchaeota archaeon]
MVSGKINNIPKRYLPAINKSGGQTVSGNDPAKKMVVGEKIIHEKNLFDRILSFYIDPVFRLSFQARQWK